MASAKRPFGTGGSPRKPSQVGAEGQIRGRYAEPHAEAGNSNFK